MLSLVALLALGNDAAVPAGEPLLEPPTLHSLGVAWVVRGDANRNARVAFHVRKPGGAWTDAGPLFRVERGQGRTPVPEEAWLFAGSAVLLEPDTAYELRLALADPDGGAAERVLAARTRAEPAAPGDLRVFHVAPGPGGGEGTAEKPFRGLKEAQSHAKPGTLFLLRAGVYAGVFAVYRSGEPGKPIVWRGAGAGDAILDAEGRGNAVTAGGIHDVWFERLLIRNATKGINLADCSRLVVRRCRFEGLSYPIVANVNEKDQLRDLFISDNRLEGPCTWPRTQGIESPRGIQVTGSGHVICYNRIRGFADGVDTMPSARCGSIDIHNNEISEQTDDGIELDFSDRNVRCFRNRLTNVFQGISTQPVHGGPAYIFRNVLYNVSLEPFKTHSRPSGVLMIHNTVVKRGRAHLILTSDEVRNSVSRNNLFVGTSGDYAFVCDAQMVDCSFDYDGFAGGPWGNFLKWNGARYDTVERTRARAPVYRHAVAVAPEGIFAAGGAPPADPDRRYEAGFDARLKEGTAALDAGEVLPGFNDGFSGRAPDLGACELGRPLPHYGPRPEK